MLDCRRLPAGNRPARRLPAKATPAGCLLGLERGRYACIPNPIRHPGFQPAPPVQPDPPDAAQPFRLPAAARLSMIAFVNAVEALRMSNYVSRRPLYRWSVLTPDGAPATAATACPSRPPRAWTTRPPWRPCSSVAASRSAPRQRRADPGADAAGAPGHDAGQPLYGQLRAGQGRLDERLSLRRALGKPVLAARGILGRDIHRRPVRDRPRPHHLFGRHRAALPDAGSHGAALRRR